MASRTFTNRNYRPQSASEMANSFEQSFHEPATPLKSEQQSQATRAPSSQQKRSERRKKNTKNAPQNQSAVPLREIRPEHLRALKVAFESIVKQNFLSTVECQTHLRTYDQFRTMIREARPDAQVTLYGSLLFNCYVRESNLIDIDVQLDKTLPYQVLKEVLELVSKSVHYKDARMVTDGEILSLELRLSHWTTVVRVTSSATRDIHFSELIDTYTRFDRRLLPLLRMFRILSKTCQLDRDDLGTLHPAVLHLMVIHFLQQVEPPVLPCLHEYVLGVDQVPSTLTNEQAEEFFQKSHRYSTEWRSSNTTPTELLFLQILSYYIAKFPTAKVVVSIQTRMPVVKSERQLFNRKLLCADPIFPNRSLSFTMKASRSTNYFERTMRKALSYFGQLPDEETHIPVKQCIDVIDKSYNVFSEHFPRKFIHSGAFTQDDIRRYYKQILAAASRTHDQRTENQQQIGPDCRYDEERDTNSSSASLYTMEAKNFGAEEGAPSVCTICHKGDHIRFDCPDLELPEIIGLPRMSKEWIEILCRVCRQVTDQCKLTKQDHRNRKDVLTYLQEEFRRRYPSCNVYAYGSSDNGFGFRESDLDISVILAENDVESNIVVLQNLCEILQVKTRLFSDVNLVRDARVPVIRFVHCQLNVLIDITLHNALAIENTRLLKTYSQIDSRVSELGYMIKCLTKTCDIGDASRGTLSSYAYIIMLIHFLQQTSPPVLPVLQQLYDGSSKRTVMVNEWDVYFYDDLSKLNKTWFTENSRNRLSSGELWLAFLRYYTEQFDYERHVVTIRQFEPLRRDEKGWFRQGIAVEDPFILTHNLADKLSLQKWSLIRRVFIRAREQFGFQSSDIDIHRTKLGWITEYLFDVYMLCPENADKLSYAQDYSADGAPTHNGQQTSGKQNANNSTSTTTKQRRW